MEFVHAKNNTYRPFGVVTEQLVMMAASRKLQKLHEFALNDKTRHRQAPGLYQSG